MRKILVASTMLVALLAVTSDPSLATPGSGFTPNALVNGHFSDIQESTDKTEKWDMFVKTKGDTDVGADELTIAGGGYSGWHAHPAPVFVTVTQGSVVWYDGSNPICAPRTYTAGQSFIEPAQRTHYVRNASATDPAVYKAVRMNPTGVAFRQDRPQPSGCNF